MKTLTIFILSVYLVTAHHSPSHQDGSHKKHTKRGIFGENLPSGPQLEGGFQPILNNEPNNLGDIAVGQGGLSPPPINSGYSHGSAEHLDIEDQQAGIRNFGSGSALNIGTNGYSSNLNIESGLNLQGQQLQQLPSGPRPINIQSEPGLPLQGQQNLIQLGAPQINIQEQLQSQLQTQGQIQAQQSYRVHLGQQAIQTVQVNRHIHVQNKYGNIIPRPYPVQVTQDVHVPVPQPYPVKVDKPYPVKVLKPYHVHEIKEIPYPVIKNIPHPVPYRVEIPHHYPVKVPVPQPYKVPRPVPVPVKVHVPVPVVRQYPVYYKQLHAHIHQPPAHLHIH